MRTFLFVFVVLGLGLAAVRGGSVPERTGTSLDRFVARVNGRIITYGDILLAAHEPERRLRAQTPPADIESRLRELYARALQQTIERALILEEAARRQAQLDDRAIDDHISQIVRERFQNDRTAFLQALAEENLSFSEFRERTRDNLLIGLMRRQEIAERVRVSPRELRDAYEQQIEKFRQPEELKLSVILIHRGETPADRTARRERAHRIEERLRAREDFAAVARETSEGFGAAAGGSWDWVRTSEVTPELRETVAQLSPGEISSVVETDPWFFLVRLDARRPERVIPFEEVRHQIEADLLRTAEEKAYRHWVQALSARHHVARLSEPWIQSP